MLHNPASIPPYWESASSPPTKRFSLHIDLIDDYCSITGLNSDAKRKHLIRFTLGEHGRELADGILQRAFDATVTPVMSVDTLVEQLTALFDRPTNKNVARARFVQLKQGHGETITQFDSRLRSNAVDCHFSNLSESLMDKLVVSVNSDRLREKFLSEGDRLTYDRALEIGRAFETAGSAAKELSTSSRAPRVDIVSFRGRGVIHGSSAHRGARSDTPILCYRCNRAGHLSNSQQCPARNDTCRNCGIRGHFAVACRRESSSQSQPPSTFARGRGNSRGINRGASSNRGTARGSGNPNPNVVSVVSEPNPTVVTVTNASVVTDTRIFIDLYCLLGGTLQALLDTGASRSIISQDDLKRLHMQDFVKKTDVILTGYNGNVIPTYGEVDIEIFHSKSGFTGSWNFVVTQGPTVCGIDHVRDLGVNFDVCCGVDADVGESLCHEFESLFRDELGCASNFVHKIRLKEGAVPKQQGLRSLPFSVRDKVDKAVSQLEERGCIERVPSASWISNIVPVQKPDGTVRLCFDAREINKNIIVHRHPLPKLQEMVFNDSSGATYFTKLDLSSAYHQVPLDDESRDVCGFITHQGVFRWIRMPFGIASASSAFQSVIEHVVQGIQGVRVYQDDIAIMTPGSVDDHLRVVRQVFQRLSDEGMRLKRDKCRICVREITFLGFLLSHEGIKPALNHVQTIERLEPPKDIHGLRSFLGMVNFYNHSIPKFAELASPLFNLLRKGVAFVWSNTHYESFHSIKQALITASETALRSYVPGDLSTTLITDASNDCIAAVLTQGGRPVSYYSRRLCARELNYSVGEKECLAVLEGIEYFHVYLYGFRFTVKTDHIALTSILSANFANLRTTMRISRWTQRLLRYTFDIVYIRTNDNPTDCLTRLPYSSEDIQKTSKYCDDTTEVETLLSVDVSKAVAKDDVMTMLKANITGNWPSRKRVDPCVLPYYQVRDSLSIDNGLVYYLNRVVVPISSRQEVLRNAHSSHIGRSAMLRMLREKCWWPNMTSDVDAVVRECVECQMSDKSCKPLRPPLRPIPLADGPWSEISIDIVGPFHDVPLPYAIVITDRYSHYPEVQLLPRVGSADVIAFLRSLFTRYGSPRKLTSDNGPQFIANDFQEFLVKEDVKHILITPYHPSSNGLCERFNSVIVNSVKMSLSRQSDVLEDLQCRLKVYRATPHPSTSKSPFFLLFGREMRTPLTDMFPREPHGDPHNIVPTFNAYQEKMAQSRSSSANSVLHPGDKVMLRKFIKVPKGESKWSGPFSITKSTGPNTYIISDGRRVHADQLSRYRSSILPTHPPEEIEDGDFLNPPPTPEVVNDHAYVRPQRRVLPPLRYRDDSFVN
jgi:hypothetical protein